MANVSMYVLYINMFPANVLYICGLPGFCRLFFHFEEDYMCLYIYIYVYCMYIYIYNGIYANGAYIYIYTFLLQADRERKPQEQVGSLSNG